MPTDHGLKDLSFSALDGGVTTPTATASATVVTGTAVDLIGLDTANTLLPPEIAIRFGAAATVATGTGTGTTTPVFDVHALWLTTISGGTPEVGDKESDLAIVAADTTTIAGVTTGAPYNFQPSNTRIIATKGRFLRLRYKINDNTNVTVKFGASIAPVFGQTA